MANDSETSAFIGQITAGSGPVRELYEQKRPGSFGSVRKRGAVPGRNDPAPHHRMSPGYILLKTKPSITATSPCTPFATTPARKALSQGGSEVISAGSVFKTVKSDPSEL
jgi:hypothetical protein